MGRRQWHHVNLSHSFELSLKFSQNSVDRKQIDLVLREHFFSNFSILWKFHVVKTRRYASCLFRDHVVVFRFVNFIEREQNLYDFLILWKFHVVETRRYASRLFRDHIVVLSICEFYSDYKGWYWAQNAQQYSEENIVRIEFKKANRILFLLNKIASYFWRDHINNAKDGSRHFCQVISNLDSLYV